jgi:hypothetical protein
LALGYDGFALNVMGYVMPEDTASPNPEFEAIAQSVRDLALAREGNVEALLGLLRTLEKLHREIEDGPFRQALPTNRRALYGLLQDMERAGGWPYIPRLRLRSIMHWIEELEDPEDELLEEV